jgi:hypothetical protein
VKNLEKTKLKCVVLTFFIFSLRFLLNSRSRRGKDPEAVRGLDNLIRIADWAKK